jgi:hypothetical protein
LIGDILRVAVGRDELLQKRCRRGVVARRYAVDADNPGAANAGDLGYRAADAAETGYAAPLDLGGMCEVLLAGSWDGR